MYVWDLLVTGEAFEETLQPDGLPSRRRGDYPGSLFLQGCHAPKGGSSVGALFHRLGIILADSPMWCTVVKIVHGCIGMKAKKGEGKKPKVQSAAAVRASISFPPAVYETLETIAKEKKVSLAWVVREAAEKYIAEKWPLFARS
jgi:hypothetical protein